MEELLIVGGGLAGSLVAIQAADRKIPFHWMSGAALPGASMAAYGMCNPVHFRNKVPAWMAEEFYPYSQAFFKNLNAKFGARFYAEMPIHHLVNSEDEFTLWRQQVESTPLWKFTPGDRVIHITEKHLPAFKGSIEINAAFFINIPDFIENIKAELSAACLPGSFDYGLLGYACREWKYDSNHYRKIIFTEGYYAVNNPFFKELPFNPCKGEIIKLRIPALDISVALHKRNVLAPLHDGLYSYGATYEWEDMTFEPSEKGRRELELSLKEILGEQYAFEVVEQKAGVRPAMSDRRPVVGWHPVYNDIGIVNGFGSRGLLVGPNAAACLLDNWVNGQPILADWDVHRFRKRLIKSTPVFS